MASYCGNSFEKIKSDNSGKYLDDVTNVALGVMLMRSHVMNY
jgi:hypothetical protein